MIIRFLRLLGLQFWNFHWAAVDATDFVPPVALQCERCDGAVACDGTENDDEPRRCWKCEHDGHRAEMRYGRFAR